MSSNKEREALAEVVVTLKDQLRGVQTDRDMLIVNKRRLERALRRVAGPLAVAALGAGYEAGGGPMPPGIASSDDDELLRAYEALLRESAGLRSRLEAAERSLKHLRADAESQVAAVAARLQQDYAVRTAEVVAQARRAREARADQADAHATMRQVEAELLYRTVQVKQLQEQAQQHLTQATVDAAVAEAVAATKEQLRLKNEELAAVRVQLSTATEALTRVQRTLVAEDGAMRELREMQKLSEELQALKDEQIKALTAQLAQRDTAVEESRAQAFGSQLRAEGLCTQLAAAGSALQEMTASFQQLLAAKDEALVGVKQQLEDRDEELAKVKARVAEVDAALAASSELLAKRDADAQQMAVRLAERDATVAGLAAQAMELRVALKARDDEIASLRPATIEINGLSLGHVISLDVPDGDDACPRAVAFDPLEPSIVAAGGTMGHVSLWDGASGMPIAELHPSAPGAEAADPGDGTSGAAAAAVGVQAAAAAQFDTSCVAFSADGTLLAVAFEDGTVKVWCAEEDEREEEAAQAPAQAQPGQGADTNASPGDSTHAGNSTAQAAAGPAEAKTAAGSAPAKHSRLSKVSGPGHSRWLSAPCLTMQQTFGQVSCLAFAHTAALLLAATHTGSVHVWDLVSGKLVCSLPALPLEDPAAPVTAAAAAAASEPPAAGEAHAEGATTGDGEQRKASVPRKLLCVAATANGGMVFAGDPQGTIHVWFKAAVAATTSAGSDGGAAAAGPETAAAAAAPAAPLAPQSLAWELAGTLEAHTAAVTAMAVSSDGSVLLTSSMDASVRCWDLVSGEFTMLTSLEALPGAVSAMALAGDGLTVAVGCLAQGKAAAEVEAADALPRLHAGSGTADLSGSTPREVLPAPPTATELASVLRQEDVKGTQQLTADNDGMAGSRLKGTVSLWQLGTGKQLASAPFPMTGGVGVSEGAVARIAFSADGALLAACSHGNEVLAVWRVQKGPRPYTFEGV